MAHSNNVSSVSRRARRALSNVFILGGLAACGSPAPDAVVLSHAEQPIFGGRVDTNHPEVMLLENDGGFLCTGTVIRADSQEAFLLTAAHCVTEEDGTALPARGFQVIAGEDFSTSTQAFAVESISVEPEYDGSFAVNDIAVVRFFADEAALSAIPVLGAADDTLAVGDELVLVGYGQTEGDDDNTRRRRVSRTIDTLDEQLIVYSQADARGACFGDSGGPVLARVGGEERVAAVISGGVSDEDEGCAGGIGVAIRASGHDAFIQDALATGAPG